MVSVRSWDRRWPFSLPLASRGRLSAMPGSTGSAWDAERAVEASDSEEPREGGPSPEA